MGDDFDAKIDSGSDSDFKASPLPKAQEAKPAATKKKLQNFGSVSDDEDGFGAKPPAKKAKTYDSDMSDDNAGGASGSDDSFGSSPKKAKHGSGQKKAKKSAGSDSDDAVFDLSNVAPARDRPGRAKKAVNYQNFDDGSDDEDF